MKNYKVRVNETEGPDGLIEVPGVEAKIEVPGIKERFIITRVINRIDRPDTAPTSNPDLGISKKYWNVTEYSTGLKMPGSEEYTRKAALESFLKAMNPRAWKTFKSLIKKTQKKYWIANS